MNDADYYVRQAERWLNGNDRPDMATACATIAIAKLLQENNNG